MNANPRELSVPRLERDVPCTCAPTTGVPRHPGRTLEEQLRPLGMTQTQLAVALGVSRRRVNELIRGRRGITPDTALRLASCVGHDALYWMHLQVAWDLHLAEKTFARAAPKTAASARAAAVLAGNPAD